MNIANRLITIMQLTLHLKRFSYPRHWKGITALAGLQSSWMYWVMSCLYMYC